MVPSTLAATGTLLGALQMLEQLPTASDLLSLSPFIAVMVYDAYLRPLAVPISPCRAPAYGSQNFSFLPSLPSLFPQFCPLHLLLFVFEVRSYSVAQAGLKLMVILLPQLGLQA